MCGLPACMALPAASLLASLGDEARAQARGAGELQAGGTGAGIGPLQKVLEGQPGLRFVPNLGTGGGLKALAAGAIDLAVTARALTDAEKAQGLVERELFRTPIVFAVHADVALRRATVAELAALYGGRAPAWPGGVPVRPVLRPESDSDSRFLNTLGPAMTEAHAAARARVGVHLATTDADATAALESVAGSLGVTTLGLLRAEGRRAHPLELDGVRPDLDALASRRYPHAKSIHLVTRGAGTPEARALASLMFTRPLAQRLATLGCAVVGAA